MINRVLSRVMAQMSSRQGPPQRPSVEQLKSVQDSRSVTKQIVEQRKEWDKELKEKRRKESDLQVYNIDITDIQIDMTLYMSHECYKCWMTDAMMNYYQISYQRVQNVQILDDIKRSKYIKLDKYEWPVLKYFQSGEALQFYTGYESIIHKLIKINLIYDLTRLSNSAWTEQGKQYIMDNIKTQLDLLFLNPALTWQVIYKTSPGDFIDGKTHKTIHLLLKLYRKALKECTINTFTLLKNRKQYMQSVQGLIDAMTQWGERLQGKDFHGGDKPDEADFLLYGLLQSKYNSSSFRKFIENKFSTKSYGWFLRMQQVCRYEKNRFYTTEDAEQL